MRRRVSFALALCVAVGLWVTAPARGEQVVLRLGHIGGPGSLFDYSAVKFATAINEKLKGQVEVKPAHSAQLGTDEQVIKGLRVGTPEMAILSTIMENADPRFALFELPYLIGSRAQMKKLAEGKPFQAALLDGMPAKGMRVLGVLENGYRHITNNVRPVVKPDDLKGMKLRIPSGAWRLKMFKTYGANPSPLPLKDTYAALKAGSLDGQENPFAQIAPQKFQEVQKYLSMSGHVYSPAYLVIGEEVWKKLPKEAQALLAKTAAEVGEASRSEGERLDKDLLAKLVPPMKQNEVDRAAFEKASASLYEEFGKQVPGGAELVALVRSVR